MYFLTCLLFDFFSYILCCCFFVCFLLLLLLFCRFKPWGMNIIYYYQVCPSYSKVWLIDSELMKLSCAHSKSSIPRMPLNKLLMFSQSGARGGGGGGGKWWIGKISVPAVCEYMHELIHARSKAPLPLSPPTPNALQVCLVIYVCIQHSNLRCGCAKEHCAVFGVLDIIMHSAWSFFLSFFFFCAMLQWLRDPK